MRKREILTLTALAFSVGTILGFLISPIKKGIGNDAGNKIYNYYDKKHPADEESKPQESAN